MAHEELKAMYEIDKQHSETPWEWWEFEDCDGHWIDAHPPEFFDNVEYRRKADAPVWPVSDDAEDARKWRELEAFYQDNGITDTAKKFLEIIEPKQELIQGYTAEQWQVIIDGKFLCEFTNDRPAGENPVIYRRFLKGVDAVDEWFIDECGTHYKHCRPLRMKGHRQPWFGGECPVALGAKVVVTSRAGVVECCQADDVGWQHKPDHQSEIVEFIEL